MRTVTLAAGIATLALGLGAAPAQEKSGLDPQLAKEIRRIVREEVRAALKEAHAPVAVEQKAPKALRWVEVAKPVEPEVARRVRTLTLKGEPGETGFTFRSLNDFEEAHEALKKAHGNMEAAELHEVLEGLHEHEEIVKLHEVLEKLHGNEEIVELHGKLEGMHEHGDVPAEVREVLRKFHEAQADEDDENVFFHEVRRAGLPGAKVTAKAFVIGEDGAPVEVDADSIRAKVLEALENLEVEIDADVKALRLGGDVEHEHGQGAHEHGEHAHEHGEEQENDDSPHVQVIKGEDGNTFRVMLRRTDEGKEAGDTPHAQWFQSNSQGGGSGTFTLRKHDAEVDAPQAKRIELRVISGEDGKFHIEEIGEGTHVIRVAPTVHGAKVIKFDGGEAQVWIQKAGDGAKAIQLPAGVQVQTTRKAEGGEAQVKVLRVEAPKKGEGAEGCCEEGGEAQVKVLRIETPKKGEDAEGCCEEGSSKPPCCGEEKPKGRIM